MGGSVNLEYDAGSGSVVLSVPGQGVKDVTILGLAAGKTYDCIVGKGPSKSPWPTQTCGAAQTRKVVADKDGVLTFKGTVGDKGGPCVITVKASNADVFVVL